MSLDNTVGTRALTATLTGVTRTTPIMIAARVRPPTGAVWGSTNVVVELITTSDGTGSNNRMTIQLGNATPTYGNISVSSPVDDTAHTFAADAWSCLVGYYNGFTGVSSDRAISGNGGAYVVSGETRTDPGADLNYITIGRWRNGNTNSHSRSYICDVSVWINPSTAAKTAARTEYPTTWGNAISVAPNYNWRMDTGTLTAATVGGVTLTPIGTSLDSAFMPTGLSGGGGGGGGTTKRRSAFVIC